LGMTKDAQPPSIPHWYHLGAVIAHWGRPNIWVCRYITFLRLSGQWIEFNDRIVHSVTEKDGRRQLPWKKWFHSNCQYPAVRGRGVKSWNTTERIQKQIPRIGPLSERSQK
jgi:hypothetical protein